MNLEELNNKIIQDFKKVFRENFKDLIKIYKLKKIVTLQIRLECIN